MNTDLSHLLGSAVSPDVPSAMQSPDAMAVVSGGGVSYDGASKVNQLGNWVAPIRSADAEILREKASLDGRVRAITRNDAYVAAAAQLQKDAIVGQIFRLNAKPLSTVLFGREDDVWETEAQEEIETKFALWAEGPENWADASRRNNLTDLVRLAVGTYMLGGEVLASGEWLPDRKDFRTAMLMLDADRLSTPTNLSMNRNIRAGVERSSKGEPIAYHIRNAHPSDVMLVGNPLATQTWKRVRARTLWGRQNILHIYETLRPDQTRGIAAMVTALSEMRMLQHFRKTELQRAVIAASYGATMETDLPYDAGIAMGVSADEENSYESFVQRQMALAAEFMDSATNLHMDGARIPMLLPNMKLKIQNPGAESPAGDKFEASMLRYIASAAGVSYEQLSRDYTQTNYSSARASIGESLRGMLPRKRQVADATASFMYRLWFEEAVNYNLLECLKRPNMPLFYEGLNAGAYTNCDWIGAGQGQIDPLKETQASVLKLKSGLSTQEIEIAKMSGGDWRTVKRQIARERAEDEAWGNPSVYDVADTTDMTNSLSGSEREASDAA